MWHVDHTRYGNASDTASRYASQAIRKVARDGVLIYNHRHGLSEPQLDLVRELMLSGPLAPKGGQRLSARVLVRRGFAEERPDGRLQMTEFGIDYVTGRPMWQGSIHP